MPSYVLLYKANKPPPKVATSSSHTPQIKTLTEQHRCYRLTHISNPHEWHMVPMGWLSNLKKKLAELFMARARVNAVKEVCCYRNHSNNKGRGSAEALNWEINSGVKHYPINDRVATQGKLAEGTFIKREFRMNRKSDLQLHWVIANLPARLW